MFLYTIFDKDFAVSVAPVVPASPSKFKITATQGSRINVYIDYGDQQTQQLFWNTTTDIPSELAHQYSKEGKCVRACATVHS